MKSVRIVILDQNTQYDLSVHSITRVQDPRYTMSCMFTGVQGPSQFTPALGPRSDNVHELRAYNRLAPIWDSNRHSRKLDFPGYGFGIARQCLIIVRYTECPRGVIYEALRGKSPAN